MQHKLILAGVYYTINPRRQTGQNTSQPHGQGPVLPLTLAKDETRVLIAE